MNKILPKATDPPYGLSAAIYVGDAASVLPQLKAGSVHTCVTSPPYYGLRDYGVEGQIGLEATPEEYVAAMVEVFREVRRVLRDDGTLWLNLGDSYANTGKSGGGAQGARWKDHGGRCEEWAGTFKPAPPGLKPKDLVGIPWRVAFALQADGWYLRSDIIWHKPNPMPESVTDRPTRAHEYVFLLSKSERYAYDHEAVKEPSVMAPQRRSKPHARRVLGRGTTGQAPDTFSTTTAREHAARDFETRNLRDVWSITTKPFKGAHFAVMPPDLVEPCVKAGSPVGGRVLDPFMGAGTTWLVARALGREFDGIELNPAFAELAIDRVLGGGIPVADGDAGDATGGEIIEARLEVEDSTSAFLETAFYEMFR